MIIVTGTKRSGTSMWMQILKAAGFPVIGDAFPKQWERSIKDANPAGFYESKLRSGIYFKTNPHPKTGAFLHPDKTRHHAVKVFIPGLCRTDYAYLSRVLSTMRDWREYTASLERLHAFEDAYNRTRDLRPGETEEQRQASLARLGERRGKLPPPVEWWFETYELVRDVATRRYPFHLVTYRKLLQDPEMEITRALKWIGKGDVAAAIAAVRPGLRTQEAPDVDVSDILGDDEVDVMDAVYESIHSRGGLQAPLLERMNAIHAQIEPRYARWQRRDDAQMEAAPQDEAGEADQ
ncbi:MAG: hypothetical protein VX265_16820 [Myxococcota bacterium]|nr:hypothetical protein [Myxococcota bacterium]